MKMRLKIIETVAKTYGDETTTPLSKRIAVDYLDALFRNDIQAIMSNYTNESIVITLKKTYKGLNEIKAFIYELIQFFSGKNTVLILDKIAIESEIVYLVWHAILTKSTISIASDTFFIEDEKISKHTFVCQLDYSANTLNLS